MIVALITIAVILVLYGVVSKPLGARGITSAMVFTAAGLAAGTAALDLVNIHLESIAAQRFCELTLVFLLFSDATRIDLAGLRRHLGWPSRLLLIGLPLTILAGLGAGLLILPGITLAGAFVLATMVCPTDAALGQRVVTDEAVPSRVRQALDVESGLNDGLAVPFFLVAVDISLAQLSTGVTAAVVRTMAEQIGWGLAAGIASGTLTGLLFRAADRREWLGGQWRQILPMLAALLAYLTALQLDGSGFIAAFTAGMTFGYFSRRHDLTVTRLNEDVGGLLAGATWVGFGALAVGMLLPHVTWQIFLYAVLSLTLLRMIPVAIALLGTRTQLPTIAFIGWFGPRGLASIVFALIAVDEGIPNGQTLFTTVMLTILLSVFLHGLSSVPLVATYSRWYSQHTTKQPTASEAKPTTMSRLRHHPTPD
ncbi:sodium:proton antiporter [Amycolatopsis sp. GM8]|uniref:cation:proton antiporter n=1 Tax=Amycolatopsis sp. GM8 TaxID=2896530 RepID=UPI001F01ABE8|nr:cation:proton antiporter [Amycolatopsis sp. GM8]